MSPIAVSVRIRRSQRNNPVARTERVLGRVLRHVLATWLALLVLLPRTASAADASPVQLVIGIAGGTGVGKTTMAQRLAALLGDRATVISADHYNKYSRAERERLQVRNHDPTSIDYERLRGDLADLRNGQDVKANRYDHSTGTIDVDGQTFHPRPVIIVDGLHAISELSGLLNLKVFVHADDETQTARTMARDTKSRGYDEATVRRKIEGRAALYRRFVYPQRRSADLVVHSARVVPRMTRVTLLGPSNPKPTRYLVHEQQDQGRAAAAFVYRQVVAHPNIARPAVR